MVSREEILQYIQENDAKFIRLAFCDLNGTLKNISVMASEFPRVLDQGAPIDGTALGGRFGGELLLFPDIQTTMLLPWRPRRSSVVRLMCDVRYMDGRPFELDARAHLKRQMQGLTGVRINPQCEFYLFQADEKGLPTRIPHDEAGYLDIAPLDRGENIRREICLALETMGVPPESSHHERGPGQNEIIFRSGNPLRAADDFIAFKTMVKTLAGQNGLFASFHPRPLPGEWGSGLHLGMEVEQGGEEFVARVLDKLPFITAFLNASPVSYARLNSLSQPYARRMAGGFALRTPDSLLNPYLAFSVLLGVGQLPVTGTGEGMAMPRSLSEAVELARESKFIREQLGDALAGEYLHAKAMEASAFEQAVEAGETELDERYFRRA